MSQTRQQKFAELLVVDICRVRASFISRS